MTLSFDSLRERNIERLLTSPYPDKEWGPELWFQALAGEVGEYANLRKKFVRESIKEDYFLKEAKKELGDIQTYLDILAWSLNIDLGEATKDKFNEVSKRIGMEIYL